MNSFNSILSSGSYVLKINWQYYVNLKMNTELKSTKSKEICDLNEFSKSSKCCQTNKGMLQHRHRHTRSFQWKSINLTVYVCVCVLWRCTRNVAILQGSETMAIQLQLSISDKQEEICTQVYIILHLLYWYYIWLNYTSFPEIMDLTRLKSNSKTVGPVIHTIQNARH